MADLVSATAHGKVILSGEHSVVHGYPAVVAGCDLNVTASVSAAASPSIGKANTFIQNIVSIFAKQYELDKSLPNILLSGDLPTGCGLGSSAAVAHAVFKTLLIYFNISYTSEELFNLTMESEKFAHGNPSGIDPAGSIYGGLLRFQKINNHFDYQKIPNTSLNKVPFVLINTGKPQENTKEMIEIVTEKLRKPKYSVAMKNLGRITEELIETLTKNAFEPEILTANEKYLEELEIVSPIAFNFILEVEKQGGRAKVTGAGGVKRGSGMILAHHSDSEKLVNLCQTRKWEYYQTFLGTT